jgi:molybdenum cofactor cytidylyltransferase
VNIAAVILAAGESKRLGRRKQLEPVDGEPLLRRTARLALAARVSRVGVVLGAYRDDVLPALAGLDVDVLDNPGWSEGMASSLRIAAAWAQPYDALLVLVCDQPDLTTDHLNALLALAGDRAVASGYAGTAGVPAIIPRAIFPALAALTGDRGARGLLGDAIVVPWEPGARDVD